jgi:hypothetical protein
MSPSTATHHFGVAETLRWPSQAGDYILWMRMKSPFASNAKWSIPEARQSSPRRVSFLPRIIPAAMT